MGSTLANFFANKELKDRILFTFLMFVIFRLGVHIPVPGVDSSVIESLFTSGIPGSLRRRGTQQILHICHEYHSLHQLIHHYAAPDRCHPHPGRMEKRRCRRIQENSESHKIFHNFPGSCAGIRYDLCPAYQQCPC